MKVLCIKETEDVAYTKNGAIKIPDNMKLFIGEPYTVIAEVTGYKGEIKWVLAERPKNCRYKKEYFKTVDENTNDNFVQPLKDLNFKKLWREDCV